MVASYSFKEVCELTGYKPSVIRYYEKEFKLNIPRDTNGRRYFTQRDLDKLFYIKNLQNQGYSNSQIRISMNDKKYEINNEVAVTSEVALNDTLGFNINNINLSDFISSIEEKLNNIECKLEHINKVINGEEKDLVISENFKLKMELKQKSYELMEIKEKLKYERASNKGLISKIFKR